jgi:hypothetical protein
MTAYILTSEHNLYDQQGEYFLAWFDRKPTPDELKRSLEMLCEEHDDKTVAHVLAGGGRRQYGQRWEESWLYLREVSSANADVLAPAGEKTPTKKPTL